MSKFYIEGKQTMDEMSHIDYKVVKGGKGNIHKVCPMKFAMNNCLEDEVYRDFANEIEQVLYKYGFGGRY